MLNNLHLKLEIHVRGAGWGSIIRYSIIKLGLIRDSVSEISLNSGFSA